jgi:hypothetical protein
MIPNKTVSLTGVMFMSAAFLLSGGTPAIKVRPVQPARVANYILQLQDAALIYEPSGKSLQITAVGTTLSRGKDWEVSQVKPYLYHLQHTSWKNFFWKVNTGKREVHLVWGGIFGGSESETRRRETPREDEGTRENITLEVIGGSNDQAPSRFFIHFPNMELVFVPMTGDVRLAAAGSTLSPYYDWQSCRLQDSLFHLRSKIWERYYWKIDTSRMQAWRTRGEQAVFCKPGGEDSALPVTIIKSSMPLSLALLRTIVTAVERQKLHEIARMVAEGKPVEQIKKLSAEFIRQFPDLDPESVVTEVSKEIEQDPNLSKEFKELKKKMEELKNKRQEFETAFEKLDQKTNQLNNLLASVLKTMKEEQSSLARSIS